MTIFNHPADYNESNYEILNRILHFFLIQKN